MEKENNAGKQSVSPAHTTRLGNTPGITTNTLEDIEEVVGIPLRLDLEQRRVVSAEESLLPVGLTEVALVLVAAAARGDGLELRHVLVGNLVLVSDHLGPGGCLVPACADLHGHCGVAQGGEDGVRDVAGLGDVHADSDGDDAVAGQVAQHGGHAGGVVLEHVTGDQTAAVLVSGDREVTVGQRTHVLVVVVVVGVVLGVGDLVGDTEVREGRGEGGQDGLDVVGGLVVRGQRVDGKDARNHLVDNGDARIGHSGQEGVELGDGLPEGLGVVGRGRELEASAGDLGVRVSLDGDRHDHTVVTSTAAAQSPVKIGVLAARSSDQLAVGGDNLEGQCVVCS